MSHWTASLFATGIEAIARNQKNGQGALATTLSSIIRHPIKMIAAFVFAPLLAFRVARSAKNPIRRGIATFGLVIAVLLAWVAGTFLGTMAGAFFVASHFGPLMAIGFVFGTILSVILSVAFQILVFNATTWLFLHMSSEDVIAHLNSISE